MPRTHLWALVLLASAAGAAQRNVPDRVPPKRSSQIRDGFGINSPLPRLPYLPWDRRWWTRMFDAGYGWIRIGQYENSSEQTSWDWVEQKRGVYRIAPQVDDYVDSLVDNGIKVQLQLLYGNPMYTARSGRLPNAITPAGPGAHPPDQGILSLFWGPSTPEQIEGFLNYTRFVVKHFRGRIRYYALWNEEDEYFWNEDGNAAEYGALLKRFIPAVHEADPAAKVIFGGLGSARHEFPPRALAACQCAAGIGVFAYHSYPGYGTNTNPERMDVGPDAARVLREVVRKVPGIRTDIEFWDDEYNSIPQWKGSDESVQAKYLPRALLYNWAHGVRTFIWQLTSGVDGNQLDYFGIIHGLADRPTDFQPLPVFEPVAHTNALFADTKPDRTIGITGPAANALPPHAPLMAFGFRTASGKAIVAYWLAAHSEPGGPFDARTGRLEIRNSGIERPVLVDIMSGKIAPLEWARGSRSALENLPFRDSVMAITDEQYFDWPVLPEAPSSLRASIDGARADLSWQVHAGADGVILERRAGTESKWETVTKLAGGATEYREQAPSARPLLYRVRTYNKAGVSAYSNIVRLE